MPAKLKNVVTFLDTEGSETWYEGFCDKQNLPAYVGGEMPDMSYYDWLMTRTRNDTILY